MERENSELPLLFKSSLIFRKFHTLFMFFFDCAGTSLTTNRRLEPPFVLGSPPSAFDLEFPHSHTGSKDDAQTIHSTLFDHGSLLLPHIPPAL